MAGHFSVSVCQSPSLSPLESLCFEQVSFWVGVVERNRGASGALVNGVPFTRLPAGELVSDLEERFPFLSVTVRQVRRALNRLVELGLLVREQFWQCRWRSDYWYSLPEAATAAAAQTAPEVPVNTEVSVSVTPLSYTGSVCTNHGGNPFLTTLPSSLPEQTRQTDVESEPQTEAQTALTVRGVPVFLQDPAQAPTPPLPPTPASSPLQGLLEASQKGRQSVVQRILSLAAQFDPASLSQVSPSAVVLNGKVHRISDGACAPLR